MAAIRPIERVPQTTAEKEATSLLALQSRTSITVNGPTAATNSRQYSGSAVSGGASISGAKGNASPPKSGP